MIANPINHLRWRNLAPTAKITSCLLCIFTALLLPTYGGIALLLTAVITTITANHLFTVILGFLNISLAIAFDYFLRAHPNGFEFYRQNGITASHLLVTTSITYLAILLMDGIRSGGKPEIKIEITTPKISKILFYPLCISVIWCIYFVLTRGGNIFHQSFALDELSKFPFLEYFSLIVFFLVLSAKQDSRKWRVYFATVLSATLIATFLLSSYRMVAIITALALLVSLKNYSSIRRSHILILWLIGYPGLAIISYYRQGVFDVSFANIIGYKNGILDNTFTGVIETALIYIATSAQHEIETTTKFLIGTLMPLPNTFIPDSLLYHIDVYERHRGRIPGGGLLPGFFIYFDYLLAPFVLAYIYIACKRHHQGSVLPSAMYMICTITVTRWWLYGPYVLFKFIGFFIVLLAANSILSFMEEKIGKKHAKRP